MSSDVRTKKFTSLAAKLSLILKQRDDYNEIQETKFHKQIATPNSGFNSDIEEIKSGEIYSMKHIPQVDAISYSINTLTPQICTRKIEEIDQKMMETSFTLISKNNSAKSSMVSEKKENSKNLSKFNYLYRICHNGSQDI